MGEHSDILRDAHFLALHAAEFGDGFAVKTICTLANIVETYDNVNRRKLEAFDAIAAGPVDEPQIDLADEYKKGLFCGLEDREVQHDTYQACLYGFEQGVERVLEWNQAAIAKAKATTSPDPTGKGDNDGHAGRTTDS